MNNRLSYEELRELNQKQIETYTRTKWRRTGQKFTPVGVRMSGFFLILLVFTIGLSFMITDNPDFRQQLVFINLFFLALSLAVYLISSILSNIKPNTKEIHQRYNHLFIDKEHRIHRLYPYIDVKDEGQKIALGIYPEEELYPLEQYIHQLDKQTGEEYLMLHQPISYDDTVWLDTQHTELLNKNYELKGIKNAGNGEKEQLNQRYNYIAEINNEIRVFVEKHTYSDT